MFCRNCGKDMYAGEKFCPNCGTPAQIQNNNNNNAYDPYQNQNQNQYGDPYENPYQNPTRMKETSWVYAILAVIFGALGGWLGLLFGIIGLVKYNKTWEGSKRVMCGVGIGLFVLWMIILFAR